MRYAIIFFFSYLNLVIERAWERLWPVVSFTLFFAALVLFNIPQSFGEAGSLLALLLFVAGLITLLLRTGAPFSLPTRADTERHIEQASALKHRPLQTLQDAPAENTPPESLSLWQQHKQSITRHLARLKIYTPAPDVARNDAWAVRQAAVLVFVVGLVAAQNAALPRLEQVFMPDVAGMISGNTKVVDLWITPPEYTHQPPVFLAMTGQGRVNAGKDIAVPLGSTLKLRASGFRFTPRLAFNDVQHEVTQPSAHNFTYEMPLQESGTLALSSLFADIGNWNIAVRPDLPPTISIDKAEATSRYSTKFLYQALDDHGVTKIKARVILAADQEAQRSGAFVEFDIPASHTTSHTEDLTASIMAGQPALITLEVEDFAGHKTTSALFAFTLPERVFTNPVARTLAENRKTLFATRDDVTRNAIANNIVNIVNRTALYKGDYRVFLALVVAAERLAYENSKFAVESVQDILWNVALKLEEGGLTFAQRDLREALDRLMDAANDPNTSKQQMQEMVEEVQQKLKQYLQQLASEMQQRVQQGKNMPVISPEIAQKFMKNIDLGQLLDQLRLMSQSNSRDGLQKMAENLKNMVDSIDMKKMDQMQRQQMEAMENLQNLQDIIHRQQTLYDKTNKSQNAKTQEQAKEQDAIRKKFGETLTKLGDALQKIPDNFAKAEQGMRASADALAKDQPEESLPHQKTALDELQKGMDDAIKQMAQAMQQSILSFGAAPDNGRFGEGYDPLGRDISNGDTKIPDEKERRRVQEIIDELRHRSNEPNRTKVEREYIDRLLEP